MSLTETLTAEHRELDALRREFLVTLRTRDIARFNAVRWRICRVLLAHLAQEDRSLYAALIRKGGPGGALAREFQVEMGDIGERFRAFMTGWPASRIEQNWEGFTVEAEDLMVRLSRRMTAEETRLYPFAEESPTALAG